MLFSRLVSKSSPNISINHLLKKFLFLIFLIFHQLALFSNNAPDKIKNDQPSRLYLSPMGEHAQLHAVGIGVFKGNLYGVELGYEYSLQWNLFAHLSLSGNWGTFKDSQDDSKIHESEAVVKALLGYVFSFGSNCQFNLTPYTGYGYQYLNQKRSIQSYSNLTYNYKLPFIPLGAFLEIDVNPHWSFGVGYEYQIDIDPHLDITALKGSAWQLSRKDNQLVTGFVTYKQTPNWQWRLEPYYFHLKTGASKATTASGLSLGIQQQTYSSWGVKGAISYCF